MYREADQQANNSLHVQLHIYSFGLLHFAVCQQYRSKLQFTKLHSSLVNSTHSRASSLYTCIYQLDRTFWTEYVSEFSAHCQKPPEKTQCLQHVFTSFKPSINLSFRSSRPLTVKGAFNFTTNTILY